MNLNNGVARARRELLVEVARLALRGRLSDGIEALPYELAASGRGPRGCCLHRDRALLRLRAMAALGADARGLEDADRPLSEYARAVEEAAGREVDPAASEGRAAGAGAVPPAGAGAVPPAGAGPAAAAAGPAAPALCETDTPAAGRRPAPARLGVGPRLALLREACDACPPAGHRVTELCRGCPARPCAENCPKKSVSVEGGRARIDAETCANCGICARNCPYGAIVRTAPPCEEACPVGAISADGEGRREIDPEACVLCGKCLRECPFGALVERSELARTALELRAGRPLAALVAPAVAVQFPGGPGRLFAALRRLGFSRVLEVAAGAEEAAREEAAELAHRLAAGEPFMATSCCPAWTGAARRALPALAGRISSTPSPLAFSAARAALERPGELRVFLSPCVAKRGEAERLAYVDQVLSAEELGALFVAAEIEVGSLEPEEADLAAGGLGRGFAAAGGAGAAVAAALAEAWTESAEGSAAAPRREGPAPRRERAAPRSILVDGLDRKVLREMAAWVSRPPEAELVEVMACAGGCLGGPCALANPRLAKLELQKASAAPASV